MSMRSVYRKIARKNGVSVQEVKDEMQKVIDAAYKNPTMHANCVPRKGDVPTIDEFISYAANRVKVIKDINEKEE